MCRSRKLDRLWRLWYALLVLLLQAFLLYAAACRYLDYRHRAMRESWRQEPMNCYLAAILISACLATLFAYAAFASTGNYADDGVAVGRDRVSLRVAMVESGAAAAAAASPARLDRFPCASRMRRHFLPPTCGLHLLMALCLLAPLPALEAEAVLHEEAPRDAIWSTSLDFLFAGRRAGHRLLAPPDAAPVAAGGTGISAEVANLILALCLLLVRYPSTFWLASRPFSLLFSGVLCACCVHVLLAREASAVLLRAAIAGDGGGCLPAAAVPALQIISDLMLLTACVAFFEFGYGRVLSSLRQLRPYLLQQHQQKQQLQQRLLQSKQQPDHLDSVSNCGISGVGPSSDFSSRQSGQAECCHRGTLAAQVLGSLLMLAAALIKAPLLWDWLALYRRRRVPILLAAIASGGAYAVVWTGAWLLLGLCRGAAICRFDVRLELRDDPGAEADEEIEDEVTAPTARGSAIGDIDGDGNPCVDGMAQSPGQRLRQQQQQQQQSAPSPYMFHHQHHLHRMSEGVGIISTISERLDAASEDGGASGSGSSGAGSDKLSGLVKYQVRRDSTGGSLKRSPGGASAGHNRVVTFKESIGSGTSAPPPQLSFLASTASPASSQVGGASSSDSGVADYQLHLLHQHHQHHQHHQQPPLFAAFGGGPDAVATYATRSEIFAPSFPPPPPPPPLSSTLMSAASASATASVSTRVPDILMTRCGQFQQQQQQQQQHQGHGSLGRGIRKPPMSLFGRQLSSDLLEMLQPPPSPPPPPPPLPPSQQLLRQRDSVLNDHVDGLCSQV